MARMPTFTRKRIITPSPPLTIESSKEAEESDEESSTTTSEETSETSTYVDSSELNSSRESLNSISSKESLKASSSKGFLKASPSKESLKTRSDESSKSSSSESSDSSTEDISESESKSEDSELASGESEAEMEEESSKDQTLSNQIKKIINGLEFSDEDKSRKSKKETEVIQPRIVSFSGLLGQKRNNGSVSQSSDQNLFDSLDDKKENTQDKELKSMEDASEREVISRSTIKSDKNGDDLEETDDAVPSKPIKRPRRKRRRKVWWKNKIASVKSQDSPVRYKNLDAGVVAMPISAKKKPWINQSPFLPQSVGLPTKNNTGKKSVEQTLNSREVLGGCVEKGDRVATDLKDGAMESEQIVKALQNCKGRVMCKKKEAFVKSQYFLRKAQKVDKKLNACEPNPKQPCEPSSKQPCKPSPKQPYKPSPKQPCKPSPNQQCKPSSKQICEPSSKQQPCKPSPKQICEPSSMQPEDVNHKIKTPKTKRNKITKPETSSEVTPKASDKVVMWLGFHGKDKYSDSEETDSAEESEVTPKASDKVATWLGLHGKDKDSEETESAEESKLFMVDSDTDTSLKKLVDGILASRVMGDHSYFSGDCFREDIRKVDEIIDSVIEGPPSPGAFDHIYSRARSRTPPIVSFRLKKKRPSNRVLEGRKNNLSFEKMKNPVSHDKAETTVKQSNRNSIPIPRYALSSNRWPRTKKMFLNKDNEIAERRLRPARKAAIDAAQKITKTAHANSRSKGQNRLDLSKFVYPAVVKTEPVDTDTESSSEMHLFRTGYSNAQTVSNVERNRASGNYPIVKTEPVDPEDTPALRPTYPNQPPNQFLPNVNSNYASENISERLASLYENLIPIPVVEMDQPGTYRSPDIHSSSRDPVPSFIIFVDQALNPSNNTAQTIPTNWDCASGNEPDPSDSPISIMKIESLKTSAPETCLSSLETNDTSLVDRIHQSRSFPLNISSPPLSSDSCLKMECKEDNLTETQYETLSKAHTHYNSVRESLKDLIPGYETIMVLNTVPFPTKSS